MELHALTPTAEIALRTSRLQSLMAEAGLDAILLTDNASVFYTVGRVINGWVYIPVNGEPLYFIRRPEGIEGVGVCYIHKPELIPAELAKRGIALPRQLGLELGITSYLGIERLKSVFPDAAVADASTVMRKARAVKTPFELDLLRRSGVKHTEVYRRIPSLYRTGMTDVDLQIEIEHTSRLMGCLGQFRIAGQSMELFMASVLVGRNSDNPTPYDFAMGGAGVDPSLPVGADGTVIARGEAVMVDANGNFTGYMTDMTRVFACGELSAEALAAHECSIEICRAVEGTARPGVAAASLYELGLAIVKAHGLERHFMGYTQQAGFIGHGLGIEINEAPVLAPRSRDILEAGNVFALEPKFVIPDTGAVGIENTYIVTAEGVECITNAPEQIIPLQ